MILSKFVNLDMTVLKKLVEFLDENIPDNEKIFVLGDKDLYILASEAKIIYKASLKVAENMAIRRIIKSVYTKYLDQLNLGEQLVNSKITECKLILYAIIVTLKDIDEEAKIGYILDKMEKIGQRLVDLSKETFRREVQMTVDIAKDILTDSVTPEGMEQKYHALLKDLQEMQKAVEQAEKDLRNLLKEAEELAK